MEATVPEILEYYSISDHFPIKVEPKLTAKKSRHEETITEFYDTRNFDKNRFCTDLKMALQLENYDTGEEAIDSYNRVLDTCFKAQCPQKIQKG